VTCVCLRFIPTQIKFLATPLALTGGEGAPKNPTPIWAFGLDFRAFGLQSAAPSSNLWLRLCPIHWRTMHLTHATRIEYESRLDGATAECGSVFCSIRSLDRLTWNVHTKRYNELNCCHLLFTLSSNQLGVRSAVKPVKFIVVTTANIFRLLYPFHVSSFSYF